MQGRANAGGGTWTLMRRSSVQAQHAVALTQLEHRLIHALTSGYLDLYCCHVSSHFFSASAPCFWAWPIRSYTSGGTCMPPAQSWCTACRSLQKDSFPSLISPLETPLHLRCHDASLAALGAVIPVWGC